MTDVILDCYCYMVKKLDGNYRRKLWAILNKSWRQHPTKQQLYGHLPPITKTTKIRRTRHVVHCWRSRNELVRCTPVDDLVRCTPVDEQSQDVQLEHTYNSSVPILGVSRKVCQKQWTIGRGSERGTEIPILIAWHDDDDHDIYIRTSSFLGICVLFQRC